jgi:hypothetical protein
MLFNLGNLSDVVLGEVVVLEDDEDEEEEEDDDEAV